jgi:hypothetical protein
MKPLYFEQNNFAQTSTIHCLFNSLCGTQFLYSCLKRYFSYRMYHHIWLFQDHLLGNLDMKNHSQNQCRVISKKTAKHSAVCGMKSIPESFYYHSHSGPPQIPCKRYTEIICDGTSLSFQRRMWSWKNTEMPTKTSSKKKSGYV